MYLIYFILSITTIALIILSVAYYRERKRNHSDHEYYRQTITLLKLQTNRNRLSPHLLFNVLSIITSGNENQESFRTKIKAILMLLRDTVEHTGQAVIPLKQEIELVKSYLELIETKIPKPFSIIYDIHPNTNMDQLLPAMILQIPVENAVKHGLLPLEGDKILRILLTPIDSGLQIRIEDNGIGFASSVNRAFGAGTGLKIIQQTISLFNEANSEKITFTIQENRMGSNPSVTGTLVEIKIPSAYSFLIPEILDRK